MIVSVGSEGTVGQGIPFSRPPPHGVPGCLLSEYDNIFVVLLREMKAIEAGSVSAFRY